MNAAEFQWQLIEVEQLKLAFRAKQLHHPQVFRHHDTQTQTYSVTRQKPLGLKRLQLK